MRLRTSLICCIEPINAPDRIAIPFFLVGLNSEIAHSPRIALCVQSLAAGLHGAKGGKARACLPMPEQRGWIAAPRIEVT
jgi:hypothetical protein